MPASVTTGLLESLRFLAMILPVFAVGIIAAEVLVGLGWIHRIAWVARPLTALGRLHPECGVSFVTAFVSPAAGNAMLVRHWEAGLISRRELMVAAIVNTFPGIVMHWRTMLPVALPLIGVLGLAYYGLLVLVGLIKTVLALGAGRLFLPSRSGVDMASTAGCAERRRPAFGQILRDSVGRSRKTLWRVFSTTVPITAVTFVLMELRVFDYLDGHLTSLSAWVPLSSGALTIVATRLGSNVGAFAVAGGLLSSEAVSGTDVLLALLTGNLLASGINLRYLIPYYLGIFGPDLGLRVLALSMGLRVLVMIGLIQVLVLVYT